MWRLWLAVLLMVIPAGAGSRSDDLFQARRAMLSARTEPDVFCGAAVDARNDVVAFPAGRSDRLYTYGSGIGRAYVRTSGRLQLVWCGKALYTGAEAARWGSKLPGNAARALSYPFGTKWGRLPTETGGMDVYSSFAGTLTTMTLSASGRVVCARTRGDPVAGEFRTALQFGPGDSCP